MTFPIDDLDKVSCNALLHELNKDNNQSWRNIYTNAGVSKSQADYLYKILNADGFVTSLYKGDGNILDSHIVSMTERGKAFYTKTNYEDQLHFDSQFTIVTPPPLLLRLVNPLLILIIGGLVVYIFWDYLKSFFE